MIDGPVIQESSVGALEARDDAGRGAGRSRAACIVGSRWWHDLLQLGLPGGPPTSGQIDAPRPGVAGRSCPTCRWRSSVRGPRRPTPPESRPCCWSRRPRPTERIAAIAQRSRGFVYGVGRMGVTGEQAELADSATRGGHRVGGPPPTAGMRGDRRLHAGPGSRGVRSGRRRRGRFGAGAPAPRGRRPRAAPRTSSARCAPPLDAG